MNRTNFILFTSFTIVIVGGLIYFLVKRSQDNKTKPIVLPPPIVPNGNNLDTDNTDPTTNWDERNGTVITNPTSPVYTDRDFPLKKGSGGSKVENLQTFLNSQGAKPKLRVDGKFGPLTEAALIAWQGTAGGNGQMNEAEYNVHVLGLPQ